MGFAVFIMPPPRLHLHLFPCAVLGCSDPGEFVVFDLTQRNGAGLICSWQVDPEWSVDDPDGVLRVKESSHPFFLRVEVEHKGHFELQGEIDGVKSNVLKVSSVANGN